MKKVVVVILALVSLASAAIAQPRVNPRDAVVPRDVFQQMPPDINRRVADFQIAVAPIALSPDQQKPLQVLKRYQIKDLTSLGKLTLQGTVVLQRGLVTPDVVQAASKTSVRAATRRQGQTFVPLAGEGMLLPVRALPGASATSGRGDIQAMKTAAADIPLDTAYIAADTLDVPAGTNIVLKEDVRRLMVIARKATFGEGVTFTYDRQVPASQPSTPAKPGKPGTPAPPDNFSTGHTGTNGTDGMGGAKGHGPFHEAPRAELWVLEMTGNPAVDYRGQDGGAGGRGGDGGDGGNGGQGSAAQNATVGCKRGPGSGGTGGNGGRGGNGGDGGDGATGGAFKLYAPAPVIAAYAGGGFYISVDPGQGGPGGVPGTPGAPGSGGGLGALTSRCGTHGRGPGSSGSQGAAATPGTAGKPGVKSSDKPVQLIAVTPAEFAVAWLNPAIKKLTPKTTAGNKAIEGEIVTVDGLYFAPSDVIEIGGGNQWQATPTTIIGDTLATFTVPLIQGGLRSVRLRRQNGVLSNEASLYVLATLQNTIPSPRITPGEKARLNGTGFTTGMRVRINKIDVGPATLIDPHTLEFDVVRPVSDADVESNPAGERVKLLVDHNGTTTKELDVILDTFVVADFGDSIFGGPGLDERDRVVTRVADALKAQPGNRKVYVQTFSHTGAKIGLTPFDNPGLAGVDRQVPTRYPTVREQVLTFAGSTVFDPKFVDLLLICAGANDVGIDTWINPETTAAQIIAATEQASYRDMLALLELAAPKFPNARVAIAGNYSPLGNDSTHVKLVPLLNAFNSIWYNIPSHVFANLTPAARQQIIDNSRLFASEANKNLARAVAEINTKLGGKPRFVFADPKFAPENAANGSSAWVFGIDTIGGDHTVLQPQDPKPVAEARAKACEQVGSPRTDVMFCKRASAGHPNANGAKAYAAAIVAAVK